MLNLQQDEGVPVEWSVADCCSATSRSRIASFTSCFSTCMYKETYSLSSFPHIKRCFSTENLLTHSEKRIRASASLSRIRLSSCLGVAVITCSQYKLDKSWILLTLFLLLIKDNQVVPAWPAALGFFSQVILAFSSIFRITVIFQIKLLWPGTGSSLREAYNTLRIRAYFSSIPSYYFLESFLFFSSQHIHGLILQLLHQITVDGYAF